MDIDLSARLYRTTPAHRSQSLPSPTLLDYFVFFAILCSRHVITALLRFRGTNVPQIQFTATDLYDKDKVDIEHVVMEEVLQLLQCTEAGLTETEAVNRINIFGPNKLAEKKEK